MDNKEIIVIKNAKVIFADLEDKGYGRNITIEVTDDIKKAIEDWVAVNNINGGTAKFKTYKNDKTEETTLQYTFKLSKFTTIESAVPESEGYGLRWGAIINLQARAFAYDNKFGKGISASLSGVYVAQPAKNSMMENLKK